MPPAVADIFYLYPLHCWTVYYIKPDRPQASRFIDTRYSDAMGKLYGGNSVIHSDMLSNDIYVKSRINYT
jgi:hypothetical protein